jgi:ABC-type nitrate/sulfonate/bicarbonate transport system permease component
MAAVVLLGVISVVLYAAIEQLEHWVLRQRGRS